MAITNRPDPTQLDRIHATAWRLATTGGLGMKRARLVAALLWHGPLSFDELHQIVAPRRVAHATHAHLSGVRAVLGKDAIVRSLGRYGLAEDVRDQLLDGKLPRSGVR